MLRAVDISKAYGENKVLTNFSFDFPEGKTTAVMGASGCGKTTLLGILMGTLSADSGRVERAEKCKISALFQEDRLCENLTASANIRLAVGKRLSRTQAAAELSAVGLSGSENKPVRELSGGMKRRVALVRALLAEYDVLFLDEPFKGLDSATRRQVMEYTKTKTAGKTVVLVTHDETESEALADEKIFLQMTNDNL